MTDTSVDTGDARVRVAIIGSGPAGSYTAGHLLRHSAQELHVDLFERLPTPWGLVRAGVAPDHPKIKSVDRVFERTAEHARLRFFGNVEFGKHVTLADLRSHYNAIVYAVGSPVDRAMEIPGEELDRSYAATDFVGWYNGHPDFTRSRVRSAG
jgi:ferredoxin--NADP+ reductase